MAHSFDIAIGTTPPSLHNKKWFVLSVHQAAECFLNAMLIEIDPKNKLLKWNGKGINHFPSMSKTIQALRELGPRNISKAEVALLELLKLLIPIRHNLWHKTLPSEIDVSISAMSLIGLSRMLGKRGHETIDDLVDQDPPVGRDIVDLISYKEHEEYRVFVEQFLDEEDHPVGSRNECSNCGGNTVLNTRCQTCFEEVNYSESGALEHGTS